MKLYARVDADSAELRPSRNRSLVELRIPGNLEEFSESDKERLQEAINQLLKIESGARILTVLSGSIRVVVDVDDRLALNFRDRVNYGLLKGFESTEAGFTKASVVVPNYSVAEKLIKELNTTLGRVAVTAAVFAVIMSLYSFFPHPTPVVAKLVLLEAGRANLVRVPETLRERRKATVVFSGEYSGEPASPYFGAGGKEGSPLPGTERQLNEGSWLVLVAHKDPNEEHGWRNLPAELLRILGCPEMEGFANEELWTSMINAIDGVLTGFSENNSAYAISDYAIASRDDEELELGLELKDSVLVVLPIDEDLRNNVSRLSNPIQIEFK